MAWLSKVFALDRKKVDRRRALVLLAVSAVPPVALEALGEQQNFFSIAFGALFVGLADPGGSFKYRATHLAPFALIGAVPAPFARAPSTSSVAADPGWSVGGEQVDRGAI